MKPTIKPIKTTLADYKSVMKKHNDEAHREAWRVGGYLAEGAWPGWMTG